MKICVYEARPDEMQWFSSIQKQLPVELMLHQAVAGRENMHLVQGCEGVSITGYSVLDASLLDDWKARGVKMISTRTIGYDHIALAHARQIGLKVCNTSYPPSGVAEYTLMLILVCLRSYKKTLWLGQVNDFSLNGLQGRELGQLTVGVVGTGSIGTALIKLLAGFGCRILATSRSKNPEVLPYAEYVDLDTLYRECDLISYHLPYNAKTYHMVDRAALSKMKDGVVLINCARGELMDTAELIHGIESGKIGGLGLDVLEGEGGISHVDHRANIISNQQMAYLRQFPNVVMTPHMAFYTDNAVRHMVENGIRGLWEMYTTGTCANML